MRQCVIALLHLAHALPGDTVDNFITVCLALAAVGIWLIALNIT
jgi:hypothetical protein